MFNRYIKIKYTLFSAYFIIDSESEVQFSFVLNDEQIRSKYVTLLQLNIIQQIKRETCMHGTASKAEQKSRRFISEWKNFHGKNFRCDNLRRNGIKSREGEQTRKGNFMKGVINFALNTRVSQFDGDIARSTVQSSSEKSRKVENKSSKGKHVQSVTYSLSRKNVLNYNREKRQRLGY